MILILLIILLIPLCTNGQPLEDINIIYEDRMSFTLEYRPEVKEEMVVSNQGTLFSKFSFYNSQVEFDSMGRPNFFRSIVLILPTRRFSVQVVGGEYKIKENIRLIPKPRPVSLKDFGIIESYDENDYVNVSVSDSIESLANLTLISEMKYGDLGLLKLSPIQKIGNEKVKIFSRIIVKVTFKEPLPNGINASNILAGNFLTGTYIQKYKGLPSILGVSQSPLAEGEWYKIEIQESGIYKLDYDYFKKLNIVNAINDINSIRLFGNGGYAIPDIPDTNRQTNLMEISRFVYDSNKNGKLDPEDYVTFYGKGAYSWNYLGGNLFRHVLNPYSFKNYYFLTFNQGKGKDMDSIPGFLTNPLMPVGYFVEKIFIENEQYNLINAGRRWLGKQFYGSDNLDIYYNTLFGLKTNLPITYYISLVRRSPSIDYLYVYENNNLIANPIELRKMDLSVDETVPYAVDQPLIKISSSISPPENRSILKLKVVSNNSESKTWLDWIEIFYYRSFDAVNNTLSFTTPDTTGIVQYEVKNLNSDVFVFDVTSHNDVKRITQVEYDSGTRSCKFQLEQNSGAVREVIVANPDSFKKPPLASRIENSNLHGLKNLVDYVIISPKEFINEARRLKNHRILNDSLTTEVVDIEHVYNEFGGGLPDPLSIREFLMYVRPQYALLFGAGHFDYRNITTTQRNWIPPYETDWSFTYINTFPRDDYYGIFVKNQASSVAIGRIPARNLEDAKIAVDKLISYDENSAFDAWRSRITYVADDGKTSTTDEGSIYTDCSESLANISTPGQFDRNKIYIVEFPTVNTVSGRRKPEANKAIVNAFNKGSLIVNFIGHGNENLWTHEAVFVKDVDFQNLRNRDRLAIVFASTCSYGKYDNFNIVSSGERLVTMENGGAIATISACRGTYNDRSVPLNRVFFEKLLNRAGDGKYPRIGDAWNFAMANNNNDDARKYHLFGDPAMRPLIPDKFVNVDSISGVSPANSVVIIKALQRIIVKGCIKNKLNEPKIPFEGSGILYLYDSKKDVSLQDGKATFQYKLNGEQLYRGQVTISDGEFSAVIPIPKDVTYGKNARLSMYIWNENEDGVGYTENITISGIDTTVEIDTVGPKISIFLDDYSFCSGNVVGSNPLLILRLEDESGINTSNVGVGHGLTAILDGKETIDLSTYYRSNRDTYKQGEARYQLENLDDGRHTILAKAWDIYNNSSEIEAFFEVNNQAGLVIANVFNYPNPFSQSTTFTFQRNSSDPLEVRIKVYSVAGRLLCTIHQITTERFVRIPWDGRDNEGDLLSNGIYFYKLIVKNMSDETNIEFMGKLAILR